MASAETLTLPKDPQAICNILMRHADRCELQLMHRRTTWLLAWYYLNGYRRFDVFDPVSGALSPHFLDEQGKMEFQSQDLLYAINQVAGRIQSMDCRLKVDTQGQSLSSQRNRALAQIVGDSLISDDQIRRIQEEFGWIYSCLGFAGLCGHITDHPTIGLTSDIEVIHPRELFPFPAIGQDFTRTQGLMRQRWVPLDHLRKVYGNAKINAKLDSLDWYECDPGENWTDHHEPNATAYWSRSRATAGGSATPSRSKDTIGVVKVRELWLNGPQNTVSRYVCASGEALLQDQDLSDLEVYCPIGYARFFNNGTFHGAGMFDLLFSVHRQFEQLSKALYNNVMDIDRYGVLVLPQGQINQNQLLRDVGRGLRVMFWEPDAVAEGFSPFPIQPHNAGDMPGRVAQFAKEAMSSINPIQDLIQEKGRVDSASGLAFLEEQITRALTTPTLGVTKAFGDMYRSLVQKAASHLTLSPRALPVGSLTLDLAGAVIDPQNFTVSFPENPLPTITGLSFSIRSVSPRSTVARKQEAIQLWQLGVEQDPMAFRLFALKEGLDFALWQDEDKGSYEMAIVSILIAYGDGQQPGQIVLNPAFTRPEIVTRILTSFIAGPSMMKASLEVRQTMILFRDSMINFMGMVLPGSIPNPDDAAMIGAMGGGPPGPGGQPTLPPGQGPPQGPPPQ